MLPGLTMDVCILCLAGQKRDSRSSHDFVRACLPLSPVRVLNPPIAY